MQNEKIIEHLLAVEQRLADKIDDLDKRHHTRWGDHEARLCRVEAELSISSAGEVTIENRNQAANTEQATTPAADENRFDWWKFWMRSCMTMAGGAILLTALWIGYTLVTELKSPPIQIFTPPGYNLQRALSEEQNN